MVRRITGHVKQAFHPRRHPRDQGSAAGSNALGDKAANQRHQAIDDDFTSPCWATPVP
jgi:hypothetical protein